MSHSPPQWRGWVPPRELAQQRRGMIPRRMMAPPCWVRALNARTRVRERACARGSLERAEVNPRARRNPLDGGVSPRARRNPLDGGVSPRARRNPLEGAVNPRARWNLLEGAFRWATPMGRGDHRSVGRAPCVHLSERCFTLIFCRF
jgi:hypothetical protein